VPKCWFFPLFFCTLAARLPPNHERTAKPRNRSCSRPLAHFSYGARGLISLAC
jgi:hypothetical protein